MKKNRDIPKNELIEGVRKYLNSLTKEELINKLIERQRIITEKAIKERCG